MTVATAAKPARKGRRPYVDPPPPLQLVTVPQFEQEHPALAGRVRKMIHRADAGEAEFIGFRRAVVRVARSTYINRLAANEWLAQRTAMAPSPSRNT